MFSGDMMSYGSLKENVNNVRRELEKLMEEWKYDKAEGGVPCSISQRVHDFMGMVEDDEKYLALQAIGVPRRIRNAVIDYLEPIIDNPYFEEEYGKRNFLRLFNIPNKRP